LCCLFYTRSGFSLLFGASQWLQGSKLFYFSAVSDKDSWTPSPSNPSSDPASRFFSALNLSPAQLFPEIFLLRTGDRALVRFSCCLCLGLSRFCATAWLWCHFSDSILPPVGLVSSAGRYFFFVSAWVSALGPPRQQHHSVPAHCLRPGAHRPSPFWPLVSGSVLGGHRSRPHRDFPAPVRVARH
jgi:hypothetical protein